MALLGVLGRFTWFRCDACGMEFHDRDDCPVCGRMIDDDDEGDDDDAAEILG